MICPNGIYDKQSVDHLNDFQKSYRDAGLIADWRAVRGNSIKQVILGWTASGKQSYLAGRPQKFAIDAEINSSTIKAIELVSSTQMFAIPSQPPTDFIDSKFKEGYLYLNDNCNNEIAVIPLSVLCLTQNGNKLTFFDVKVQWDNCYVMFPSTGGISSANGLLFKLYLQH